MTAEDQWAPETQVASFLGMVHRIGGDEASRRAHTNINKQRAKFNGRIRAAWLYRQVDVLIAHLLKQIEDARGNEP